MKINNFRGELTDISANKDVMLIFAFALCKRCIVPQ